MNDATDQPEGRARGSAAPAANADDRSRPRDEVQHGAGDDDFARRAAQRERSFFGEYWAFLRSSGRWWLIPIVVALLIVGVLVVLGGTAVAPFIYTLF